MLKINKEFWNWINTEWKTENDVWCLGRNCEGNAIGTVWTSLLESCKLLMQDAQSYRDTKTEGGAICVGESDWKRLTERGGEAESLREDGKGGGGGELPAAKLQSLSCHLHYLTFHPLQTPSSYCCSSVLYVWTTFWLKNVSKENDIGTRSKRD